MKDQVGILSAVAILAMSSLAACSSSSDVSDSPATSAEEALSMAFAMRGGVADEDIVKLDLAREKLIFECAQRKGVPVEFNEDAAGTVARMPDVPPEALWMKEFSSLGYAQFLEDPASLAAYKNYLRSDSPPMHKGEKLMTNEILYGENPRTVVHAGVEFRVTGCEGESFRELYGVDPEVYHETAASRNYLIRALAETSQRDPVKSATKKYESCTSGELSNPRQLDSVLTERLDDVAAGDESLQGFIDYERESLMLDAKCKRESALPTVFASEFAAVTENYRKENEGNILRYGELRKAGLRKAATL